MAGWEETLWAIVIVSAIIAPLFVTRWVIASIDFLINLPVVLLISMFARLIFAVADKIKEGRQQDFAEE